MKSRQRNKNHKTNFLKGRKGNSSSTSTITPILVIFSLILFFIFNNLACSCKAPLPVQDEWEILIDRIENQPLCKSIKELERFSAKYSRYDVRKKAEQKKSEFLTQIDSRFSIAQAFSADGQFEPALQIVEDLSTCTKEEKANAMHNAIHLGYAKKLIKEEKYGEASSILEKIRKSTLSDLHIKEFEEISAALSTGKQNMQNTVQDKMLPVVPNLKNAGDNPGSDIKPVK